LSQPATKISPTVKRQLARNLVGNSRGMQQVRELILQVAPTTATVLLLGETGTGKEVIAQGIHGASDRANKPFIPVNCGAIPGELLESELFGHEKGAFTGAVSARKGRFEMAEGGTLFLDEIGDMPFAMQVKLLRVLQERCFERVGGGKPMNCDVRIIAATHQNLESKVESGDFRGDLYYRLNVFPIDVPSLRERTEDLPDLVTHFLQQVASEGQAVPQLESSALQHLQQHHWPGNIRELGNLIERLAILHPGRPVSVTDLPPKYRPEDADLAASGAEASNEPVQEDLTDLFAPTATLPPLPEPGYGAEIDPVAPTERSWPLDLKAHVAEVERELIEAALADADGVIAQAAKYLKLQRTTLVEKMKKHGIRRPDEAS
jgi:sigma-54 specific flagellar transcriptional regulator A